VSQVDPNIVRQRVQQARNYMAKGDHAKAKSVLKGVDHPKAQALLAQLEAESPTPKRANLPILPMIGVLILAILACGGGFFLLNNRPTPTPAPLPTGAKAMVNQGSKSFVAAGHASKTLWTPGVSPILQDMGKA